MITHQTGLSNISKGHIADAVIHAVEDIQNISIFDAAHSCQIHTRSEIRTHALSD